MLARVVLATILLSAATSIAMLTGPRCPYANLWLKHGPEKAQEVWRCIFIICLTALGFVRVRDLADFFWLADLIKTTIIPAPAASRRLCAV